jgi:hypothetical protein
VSAQDILRSQNGVPGILNYGAQLAKNSLTTGVNESRNQIQGYLDQSLNQIQTGVDQGNLALAPQTQGSYAALDSYLDALGISRPKVGSYGSAQGLYDLTSKKDKVNKDLTDAQSKLQSLQDNWQKTHAEWSKAGVGTDTQYDLNSALHGIELEMSKYQNIIGQKQTEANQINSEYEQKTAPFKEMTASGVSQGVLDQLQNSPGYKFALNQGMGAIQNSAVAKGGLVSGNTLRSLENFGTNLADQTYQSFVSNRAQAAGLLSPYAGQTAQNIVGGGQAQAGVTTGMGSQIGNLTSDYYTNMANADASRASGIASYYAMKEMQNTASSVGQKYGSGYLQGMGAA